MTNAIVLSGGGAAGDFEVGVVRRLLEQGFTPDILVGTSVGAINATKIAEGEGTPDQGFAGLLAIWLSLRFNDHMWKPAAWVSTIDSDYARALINRLAPNVSGPRPGSNELEKLSWLLDDGVKILTALNAVKDARSLATLDPIASRFSAALDMTKLQAAGRKLRLGTVSLETGKLRFVTETGSVVERDESPVPTMDGLPVTVPLSAGMMASSSIAMLFPPVQLGDEFYVDGGHRDQLSADVAARLGATNIFCVLASPSVLDPPTPDHPDPQPVSYATKTLAEIGIRAGIAVHVNEMVAADILRPADFTGSFTVIKPTIALHDVLTIDPGLIRHSIAYGYMRAADVLGNRDSSSAIAKSADEITLLRSQIWRKECELFGRPIPTDPGADTSTPVPARYEEIQADAARLRGLVWSRRQAGGALPPDAERWGTTWEDHPWYANSEGPVTAISPGTDGIETFASARDGRTMTASWAPSTGWRGGRPIAHGYGPPRGWVEAVMTDGEVHAFVIGSDGGVQHSVRPVAGRTWSMWLTVGETNLGSERSNPGAPVHAVSRVSGEIDLFYANTRGRILTINWSRTTGWTQAREVSGGKTLGGGHVSVVSRHPTQLEIFTVGVDGGVYTAGMTAGAPWTNWTRIGTEVGQPGAYVSAVSRNLNMVDIFFANTNGQIMSAAQDPSSSSWKGWWWISGGVTKPGSYVTSVCARTDLLAAFVVGTNRMVYTASWSGTAGWGGWVGVPGTAAMPDLPVWPVSRRNEQIDIVYTTINNTIETAGCESSGSPFAGPWQIAEHWQLDDLS